MDRIDARISANKLGEYMSASPVRRRRIVADQKRPATYIVSWYRDAQDAIVAYLCDGDRDKLVQFAEEVAGRSASTEHEDRYNGLNVEAIRSFLEFEDEVDLSKYAVSVGHSSPPKIELAEVGVSVRPDIVLESTDRQGRSRIGGVKLSFPKTIPLGELEASYVGTLLVQYFREFGHGAQVNNEDCLVVDIPTASIYTAPRAHKRRLNELTAACEEIARAWEVS